ncbi:MAG TPA: hypothetical protein VFX05_15370 [Casimicrobiaceae bacterium]|nr:hypothetical protein [Casimicrobiaceae bacterium]
MSTLRAFTSPLALAAWLLAGTASTLAQPAASSELPLARWTAAWWQRALSVPLAQNPVVDEAGSRCAIGQHGEAWFLAGTAAGSGARQCSVPADRWLVVPLANQLAMGEGDEDPLALQREASVCVDAVYRMHSELDGKPVAKLHGPVRVQSGVFTAAVPHDGLVPAGVVGPLVDDGWYVVLPPQPAGRHVLRLGMSTAGCHGGAAYDVDVVYTLDVARAPLSDRRRVPTPRPAPRARGPRTSRRSRAPPTRARSPRR